MTLSRRIIVQVTKDYLVSRSFWRQISNDALARYDKPEMLTTDQGSQFSSFDFTEVLKAVEITTAVDGWGQQTDSLFIKRLWRLFKNQGGPSARAANVPHAKRIMGEWIESYNGEQSLSALAGKSPAKAYAARQPVDMMDNADTLLIFTPVQPQQQDVINRILTARSGNGIHRKNASKLYQETRPLQVPVIAQRATAYRLLTTTILEDCSYASVPREVPVSPVLGVGCNRVLSANCTTQTTIDVPTTEEFSASESSLPRVLIDAPSGQKQ